MKKILLIAIAFLIGYLAIGCGYKYPMPPEAEGGLPPESSYVHVATWDIENPIDVEVGRDYLVYVISDNNLLKCYGNGEIYSDFNPQGLVEPVAVYQAPDWSIVVADRGDSSVKFYDVDGNLVRTVKENFLFDVVDVAVDESLRIYVALRESDLILLLDTTGAVIDTVAHYGTGIRDVDNPNGMDLENGWLSFASTDHNWVEVLEAEEPYENILHLGGETHDGDTLPGYFIEPMDVSLDENGFVYVADYGNMRIQKFSPGGEFIISACSKDVDSGFAPVRVSVSPNGETLYVVFTDGATRRVEKFKKAIAPQGGGGE